MRQIDVAIAIISRGDKILICQRLENDTFGNFWEFPGGKVEPSETLEQCLARELQEELGVTVKIGARFSTVEHRYPSVAVRLFPFFCIAGGGEPVALASQRLAWVTPRELTSYMFPAANAGLIKEVIAFLDGDGDASRRFTLTPTPPVLRVNE